MTANTTKSMAAKTVQWADSSTESSPNGNSNNNDKFSSRAYTYSEGSLDFASLMMQETTKPRKSKGSSSSAQDGFASFSMGSNGNMMSSTTLQWDKLNIGSQESLLLGALDAEDGEGTERSDDSDVLYSYHHQQQQQQTSQDAARPKMPQEQQQACAEGAVEGEADDNDNDASQERQDLLLFTRDESNLLSESMQSSCSLLGDEGLLYESDGDNDNENDDDDNNNNSEHHRHHHHHSREEDPHQGEEDYFLFAGELRSRSTCASTSTTTTEASATTRTTNESL